MRWSGLLWGAAAVAAIACGGGSSNSGGGSQTCQPGPTAAMTITASGLSPVNVCVSPGGSVTFTNSGTTGFHIEYETGGASCPAVPEIAAAAQATVVFPSSATCTFHDGNRATNTAFRGTVAVSQATVSGGGY